MAKKAVIAGASGLIGSLLLDILLNSDDYDEVIILVRKESPVKHGKLKQLVINFEQLDKYSDRLTGDALFCCLGSTRKKTPDLSVYRKIDHDYPLQLAKIALANNISQYHLVSAIGANAKAKNFYTKMKGETEEDIKKVGLPALYIYQPSMLTGNRTEKRKAEKMAVFIMKLVNPLLLGSFKKYRSIAARTVAMAMYKQSLKTQYGTFVYPSDQIKTIA